MPRSLPTKERFNYFILTGAALAPKLNRDLTKQVIEKMERNEVKQLAVKMVDEAGLINLSRADLCARAGIPDGSFLHIMGCTFAEFTEELKAEGVSETVFPVKKKRANPALRKEHILNAAVSLAKDVGYQRITRDGIAERAGVSMGLVSSYFGTMVQLKNDVMRRAVKQGILEIIAQGLAAQDDHAKKAPKALKQQAVRLLAN